jgi:hypothetical protein
MLQNKVFVMQIQKPMVLLILLRSPMTFFYIFRLFIRIVAFEVLILDVFAIHFLFVFIYVVEVAFFSK